MSEMEFCLKIQLNVDILFAIFCLPPPASLSTTKWINNVFDSMIERLSPMSIVGLTWITIEAFFDIFQVTHNAKLFGLLKTTRWICVQFLLSANKQISSGWITTAFIAPWILCIYCTWNIQDNLNETTATSNTSLENKGWCFGFVSKWK